MLMPKPLPEPIPMTKPTPEPLPQLRSDTLQSGPYILGQPGQVGG